MSVDTAISFETKPVISNFGRFTQFICPLDDFLDDLNLFIRATLVSFSTVDDGAFLIKVNSSLALLVDNSLDPSLKTGSTDSSLPRLGTTGPEQLFDFFKGFARRLRV